MANKKKHRKPGGRRPATRAGHAGPVAKAAPAAPRPTAAGPADASGSRLAVGLTFAVAAVLLGSAVYYTYHRPPAPAPDQAPAQPAVQVPAQPLPKQLPPPQEQAQPPAQVPAPAQAQPSSQVPASTDASLAPDFSLVNVANGKTVTLSKLRGKVVLVDFWATWCPPCRMTIPHLMDLQKEYGGKRFTVVGISVDQQGEAAVKPFYESWKMNYPVVIDQDGSVARNYGGIRSIPTGLLIDRHGRVITGFVGYRPKEELEGIVKKALDSKS